MKIKKRILSMLLLSFLSVSAFAGEQKSYLIRIPADGILALGTEEGAAKPVVDNNKNNQNEWLDFFHKKQILLDINDLTLWGGGNSSDVFLQHLGLVDEDLPKVPFGVNRIGGLSIVGNNLTNISFMRGVKTINGNVVLTGDSISDLSPMSDVSLVNGRLALNLILLKSLNGLQNIRQVGILNLGGTMARPMLELTDISAISNIELSGNIVLGDISQYKIRPLFGSPFCNGIDSGNVKVTSRNMSGIYYITKSTEICQ